MPKRRGRSIERVRRIIHTCRMVEERGLNPFNVEVREELETLDNQLDELKSYEELCLDVEAVNMLTKVVKAQKDWLSEEASVFYADPAFIEYKLRKMSTKAIVDVFMRTWRPIACLEEISREKLIEAIEYWNHLKPLESRWSKFTGGYKPREYVDFEELKRQGIIVDETFYSNLEKILNELKEACKTQRSVSYWSFISSESFEETVKRAYMLSFLLTYGYAELKKIPLRDDYTIAPRERIESKAPSESLPISVDYERWRELSGGGSFGGSHARKS
ncbi:MAG: hypothetical protein QXU47_08705 [Candidatus Bathyarchaeia archaeon]